MSIGSRLKEERKRLKLNQEEVSSRVGVDRKTQFNYEHDICSPNADYLAECYLLGMDIQYIVTDVRGIKVEIETPLTANEKAALNLYRNLQPSLMQLIKGVIDGQN